MRPCIYPWVGTRVRVPSVECIQIAALLPSCSLSCLLLPPTGTTSCTSGLLLPLGIELPSLHLFTTLSSPVLSLENLKSDVLTSHPNLSHHRRPVSLHLEMEWICTYSGPSSNNDDHDTSHNYQTPSISMPYGLSLTLFRACSRRKELAQSKLGGMGPETVPR